MFNFHLPLSNLDAHTSDAVPNRIRTNASAVIVQGRAAVIVSDGQVWDRLPIISPPVAGSYYIVVTVGSYSSMLGYAVY